MISIELIDMVRCDIIIKKSAIERKGLKKKKFLNESEMKFYFNNNLAFNLQAIKDN